MNERARRARVTTIAAIVIVAGGAALLVRSRRAEGTDAPGIAAGLEHAPAASTVKTETKAPTPPIVPAQAPATTEPTPRPAIDPEEYVRNGPKDPLTPRELRIDVEVSPRGPLTAEPLIPRVLEVNAEVAPREPLTDEPLQPRVQEVHAEPGDR